MHPFARAVQEASGQNLFGCYQCKKCTAGCPTSAWFEWPNHSIVRMIQHGLKEELLGSKAIWMCITCETCGTRCPNGIHLSPIMDALRSLALEEGRSPAEPAVVAFHWAFVATAKRFGRVHEATMLAAFKWATKDFTTDLGVGLQLFAKGKIPLLPSSVKGKAEIRKIFA
ncbi:MAG: 4Fe-4S dicluster domain-containing protein, partial [Deltaproteobacteria bacterium]|nr:4Fe-4S dicluster domain-containing protein [Deltaproteobacteria bacterium]